MAAGYSYGVFEATVLFSLNLGETPVQTSQLVPAPDTKWFGTNKPPPDGGLGQFQPTTDSATGYKTEIKDEPMEYSMESGGKTHHQQTQPLNDFGPQETAFHPGAQRLSTTSANNLGESVSRPDPLLTHVGFNKDTFSNHFWFGGMNEQNFSRPAQIWF